MKFVTKKTEPQSFSVWKGQANDEWLPTYGNLQNPEKQDLREALFSEQEGVCVYCGKQISIEDSHIEHFRPQESYIELALEYDNLHLSCTREQEPGAPFHCGHAKGCKFSEDLVISPQNSACEKMFSYTADGAIHAVSEDASSDSARYMIDLLKLDIDWLCVQRRSVIELVFDEAFLDSTNPVELNMIAQSYRQPAQNGQLPGFGHVVARFAEQYL